MRPESAHQHRSAARSSQRSTPARHRAPSTGLVQARQRVLDAWAGSPARRSAVAPLAAGTALVIMATAVPALAADGVATDGTQTAVTSGGTSSSTWNRTTNEPSAQRVPVTQDAFTVIALATQERERIRKQQAERAERARKAKIRKAKIAAAKKERARKAAIRKARARSWVWPTASGSVSTRFGVSGSLWSSGRHTGVDFKGNSGDTVRTVHTGVVVFAGSDGAYGNHVKVKHAGGHETWYAHLANISVRVGQRVISGDQLGRMGSTGNSTGPHLHFEVHRGGSATASEPLSFLRERGLG